MNSPLYKHPSSKERSNYNKLIRYFNDKRKQNERDLSKDRSNKHARTR